MLVSEALGLVERGADASAAAEGRTVDPRLHLWRAAVARAPRVPNGLYTFVEVLERLRGQAGERQVPGAELALTSAELGNCNAALVHVLEGVAR
ncbi:hypothetical protein [Pseudonocardia sp. NPDC049154]|uniref:thiolase C-terminal domain-containing protein n=1 Tax=Pseudonocardia sp. NPDC049154 TaxID=3155501 RepID=UPI0033EBCDA2